MGLGGGGHFWSCVFWVGDCLLFELPVWVSVLGDYVCMCCFLWWKDKTLPRSDLSFDGCESLGWRVEIL